MADRGHVAAGCMSCGRPGTTAPARADGEALDTGKYMSRHGAGESCRAMEKPTPRGRGRGRKTSWYRRSSFVPSGGWDRRRPGVAGTATPNNRRSLAFSSVTRPWVPRFYVKVATWRVRQWNRSSRRRFKGRSRRSSIPTHPMGDCEMRRRVFTCSFPHHVED